MTCNQVILAVTQMTNTSALLRKKQKLRRRVWAATGTVKRLKDKIHQLTEHNGHVVDSELHSDLVDIMKDSNEHVKKTYSPGKFCSIILG